MEMVTLDDIREASGFIEKANASLSLYSLAAFVTTVDGKHLLKGADMTIKPRFRRTPKLVLGTVVRGQGKLRESDPTPVVSEAASSAPKARVEGGVGWRRVA